METFKIDSTYVSKIENGFIVNMSGYKTIGDKDKWEEIKTYCETLDQVKVKLEEIYK